MMSIRGGIKMYKNLKYFVKALYKSEGKIVFAYDIFLILLSVIMPFMTVAFPSFVLWCLTADINSNKLILYIVMYGGTLLLGNMALEVVKQYFQGHCMMSRVSVAMEFDRKLLHTDYINVESEESKKRIEKANWCVYNGNERGCEDFIMKWNDIVINVIGFLLYSFMFGKLNYGLITFLIVCAVISSFSNVYLRKWIKNHNDEWAKIDTKIEYLKKQSIDIRNGKDIRLFKIKNWFLELFEDLISQDMKGVKGKFIRTFYTQGWDRVVGFIRNIIIYGYLIKLMIDGMDIASFTFYLGLATNFSSWIKKIFEDYNDIQKDNIIINDYLNYLHTEEWTNRGEGKVIERKAHSITFENVTFAHEGSDTNLFENLSLTISEGEKVALVGMNGAGKTTLIKLLCGLYKPKSGRILVDGIDILEFNIYDYFKEISVVFQDVFPFAFTIAQNVACDSTSNIDYKRVYHVLCLAGLKEKIDSLKDGINSVMCKDLDENGIVFSGGEMQKLMLARALYKDAGMIILDEPTAALDPLAESEMYEKYNSFVYDKTSIFISHRLSSTRFVDRILFMKDGKIIEEGSHEDLIKLNGEYAYMFDVQAHYYQKEVEEIW